MKYKYIIILFALCPLSIFAQRHYKGVSGYEASFGSRLSGQTFDPSGSLYYSKYLSDKTFYKFGFNFWDTEIKVAGKYPEHSYFFNTEFRYAYTLIPANQFLFINVEAGAFVGLERLNSFSNYKNPQKTPYVVFPKKFKKNRFVSGVSIGIETEIFLSKRIGLIINVSEYYNPMSKVIKWHTVTTGGIKYLIY